MSQVINTSDKSLEGLESSTYCCRFSAVEQRPEVSTNYISVATNSDGINTKVTHIWAISLSSLLYFWRALLRPLHISFRSTGMDTYTPCSSRAGYPYLKCQIGLPEHFILLLIRWTATRGFFLTARFPHDPTLHSAMACPRTRTASARYWHFEKSNSYSPSICVFLWF